MSNSNSMTNSNTKLLSSISISMTMSPGSFQDQIEILHRLLSHKLNRKPGGSSSCAPVAIAELRRRRVGVSQVGFAMNRA
jgi:hypothetical protein